VAEFIVAALFPVLSDVKATAQYVLQCRMLIRTLSFSTMKVFSLLTSFCFLWKQNPLINIPYLAARVIDLLPSLMN
jgi:hypothetical protein